MEPKKKKNEAGEKAAQKPSKTGQSTEELTRKHLGNQDNHITDEDIRNIQITTEVLPGEGLKLPKGRKRPKDTDKDNEKTTPWDVISE